MNISRVFHLNNMYKGDDKTVATFRKNETGQIICDIKQRENGYLLLISYPESQRIEIQGGDEELRRIRNEVEAQRHQKKFTPKEQMRAELEMICNMVERKYFK